VICPMASCALQPYSSSAPRFQKRMVLEESRIMMASWASSMSCACTCAKGSCHRVSSALDWRSGTCVVDLGLASSEKSGEVLIFCLLQVHYGPWRPRGSPLQFSLKRRGGLSSSDHQDESVVSIAILLSWSKHNNILVLSCGGKTGRAQGSQHSILLIKLTHESLRHIMVQFDAQRNSR